MPASKRMLLARRNRRILVDVAKTKQHLTRSATILPVEPGPDEVIAVDQALRALAQADKRKSQVIELRYFGGFTTHEVAETLGVSVETAKREWYTARTWLRRELAKSGRVI
jgi:RNA polymerase sigma factor (sigma-70 family)